MGYSVLISTICILLLTLSVPSKADAFGKGVSGEGKPEAIDTLHLRLATPSHIAREQIDKVVAIIDESVQVAVVGDYCGIRRPVPITALSKAIPILDRAITVSPGDIDLLVSKAYVLDLIGEKDQARTVLRFVLEKQPEHFEAKMWEQHPDNWRYALHYPKWSENEKSLHPVMSKHLTLEHRVQLVRDGLQKTLAIVTQVKGPAFHPETEIKVKWVLSETPYGPLVAWYLRIIEPSVEPSTQEAFLPIFKPLFIPMEGYSLLQQLAWNPYCFVVLVRGDRAELNRRVLFGEKCVREIRNIASRLSSTDSFLPKAKFRSAMQWHMKNFDMDGLTFE